MIADRNAAPLAEALRSNFGFSSLRPGQEEAIRPVLDGRDALVVMPTGAGKSLVYQLAACMVDGTTLVVSPLIALMKDQVDALNQRGVPAGAIHSGQSSEEQREVFDAVRRQRLRLLYVAPERLQNRSFTALMSGTRVGLLAVDEAHCVSQWGHDFRPDYLQIGPAARRLGRPPVVALTATATPRVQHDIIQTLALHHPARVVTGFNRPNLSFEVRHAPTAPTKKAVLRSLLAEEPGPALIYVSTRKQAQSVASFVANELGRAAEAYHAGLPDRQRVHVQDAFIQRRLDCVVATNAFGMGVDRPDVRLVVHWALPPNVESYYQEAGRAGRDGAASRAVLLYATRDAELRRWFIEQGATDDEEPLRLHERLTRLAHNRVATFEPDELAERSGLHPVSLKVLLSMLERAGAIERLEDGGIELRYAVSELAEARLARVIEAAAEHGRAKTEALDRMVRYAEADTCRRRFILDHFGDPGPADASRCCDVCVEQAAGAEPPPDVIPAFDSLPDASRIALGLLDAVRRLPYPVGRGTLVRILSGSTASGMSRPAYTRSPYFGRLGHMRQRDVDELYRALIADGFLKVVGGDKPVVKLTPAGQRALAHREAIALDVPRAGQRSASRAKEPVSLGAEAQRLFDALRDWRTSVAARDGVPSYIVFNDRTLAAIAQARPASGDALLAVSGVGPAKLERYGDDVLRIVSSAA